MHFILSLLWNPINVIEGEGQWLLFISILIVASWLLTRLLSFVVLRVEKRLPSSHIRYVLSSLSLPITIVIWFLAVLFSIDKVTERWLSEGETALFSSLIKSALALSFGWFLFRYKNLMVAKTIEQHREEDPQIAEVLLAASKMGSVAIVILMLFLLHDITGISMTAVLAFGGVGGLALAFASQEIVQNFFGGFMLHMTRPFFHKEVIFIPQNNIEGTVESIGWYQTMVRSSQRESMYIPNSVFTRACVINKSRLQGRCFEASFFVDFAQSTSFFSFCSLMEERIRTLEEVNRQEKLTVWIKTLYGI